MSLDSTANNQTKISVVSHTASSGSLVLSTAGTSFPSVPFRLTCITGATYGTSSESLTIFAVSNVATNSPTSGQCTLTVSVAENTTDQTYGSSDYAEMRLTSGTISDLNTAVTASAYSLQGNATSSSATQSSIQAFKLGSPSITDTGIWQQLTVATTGYQQILAQNTSANSAASTDIVLNNNLGTATTYYIDLGINSSAFTGTGSLNLPNAGYLYSAGGELTVGTSTANGIHFVINSSATDALAIGTDGGITVGSPTGGDKGAGTINVAGAIYSNGTALSGTGTVTSVAISAPSSFGVTGSPITTNGTFTFAPTVPNIQKFTTSGTWTMPPGATIVRVYAIGGGGGGGSGAQYASGTGSSGGCGGGGAGFSVRDLSAAALSSTESVTVGSGGAGGASISTTSTAGANGTSGGNSFFGGTSLGNAYCGAAGGYYGSGGSSSGSSLGNPGWGMWEGAQADGCAVGSAGGGPFSTTSAQICTAGGAGGGVNTSAIGQNGAAASNLQGIGNPQSSAGGAGGTGGSSPTAGGAGTSYQGTSDNTGPYAGWGGGGGGGASTGNAGGAGGTGGNWGSGGGGGGSSVNGSNSGAGGAGGGGFVIVYSW